MSTEFASEIEGTAAARLTAFAADARRFDGVLLELATIDRDNLRAVFETIAEAGAKALDVERVSLWQYEGKRSGMVCPAAWVAGRIVDEPLIITRASHATYWNALHGSRTLAISDAHADPAAREIRDYVQRNDLGAPVRCSA